MPRMVRAAKHAAAKRRGHKSAAKSAARRPARKSKARAGSGTLAALIAVVATGAGAHYAGQHGGTRAAAFQCDPSLWDHHLYSPERFRDSNRTCVLAVGTIELVQQDPDMDDHIRMRLDPGQGWMVNQANLDHQGGDLVLEVVCAHAAVPATTDLQKQACAGYANRVRIPKVGEHVAAVGTFVTDMAHYNACPVARTAQHCWNELHPVTSIVLA